jgi:hypothetical protein
LVDAGYPLIKGYLTPYKGEKYHLPDFQRAGRGNGIKERFNYVHSSFRSVIERTFGVWKNRWHILRQMPSYAIKDQMLVVVATAVLHNFIRIHDKKKKGFKWDKDYFDNREDNDDEVGSSSQENIVNIHDEEMKVVHDNIARSICGL